MEKNSNLKNNNDQKPKKCGLAAIVESIEKDIPGERDELDTLSAICSRRIWEWFLP